MVQIRKETYFSLNTYAQILAKVVKRERF